MHSALETAAVGREEGRTKQKGRLNCFRALGASHRHLRTWEGPSELPQMETGGPGLNIQAQAIHGIRATLLSISREHDLWGRNETLGEGKEPLFGEGGEALSRRGGWALTRARLTVTLLFLTFIYF